MLGILAGLAVAGGLGYVVGKKGEDIEKKAKSKMKARKKAKAAKAKAKAEQTKTE